LRQHTLLLVSTALIGSPLSVDLRFLALELGLEDALLAKIVEASLDLRRCRNAPTCTSATTAGGAELDGRDLLGVSNILLGEPPSSLEAFLKFS
jgi:hypothetical protein